MRRLSVLAVFVMVGLAPVTLFCQESAKGSQPAADASINQVLKLNARLMAAEVKPDVPFVDSVVTADYTNTHANGMKQTKAQFLEGMKTGSHGYGLLDLSDIHARSYGDTVILEGHVHIQGTNMGKRIGDGHNLFTEVWVRQSGKWRLAAWLTLHLPTKGTAE